MLTSFNGKTITYDEIGNPVQYLGDTLTWTEGRRLASLSRPFPGKPENQTIYTYEYNAAGQRTSKTKTTSYNGESITTEFIYEGDLLVGQKTSDGKGDMTFLHDDTGAYIGLIYEGVEYYYMKNVQGDIIGIVDAEGVIQAVYTYEPFGKLFSIETKSGFLRYDGDWSVGGMNPIRYRGYYYDYDTKLYYLNSRYYDPYVGRFLNADGEISDAGGDVLGYNLFAYCFNNPVNMADSTGQWPKWLTGALNVVSGALQMAAGAALGATVGWTGIGAVAASFLIVNGAATASQGVGQIVNDVTKSNVMREDNIVRTGVKSIGKAIGGETGEKVSTGLYDAAVVATNLYAGRVGLQQAGVVPKKVNINKVLNNPLDEFVTVGPAQGVVSNYCRTIPMNGYGKIFATTLPNGYYQLADGHHRVAALRALGYTTIKIFLTK